MKKVLAVILTTLMLVSMLAGCTKKTETSSDTSGDAKTTESVAETESATAPESDEAITLRFSWWGGDERLAATLAVIDQFETLYPNITIEGEYGSSDGYSDKLSTQLAAGTAPDIIQIDPGFMPSLVSADTNYFIDYNDFGFDFSNFDENYYKQRINGNFDGKQLGIPTGLAGAALVVNQDLASAIGIDFTQDYTFDDLIEWGKKVREYDDSMYLLCANKDSIANILVNNYEKQIAGKTFFNEDTKAFNPTEDQLKQIYSFVQALYDNGVVAPASYMSAYSGDNLQSDPNWIAGKYVASFTYTSTAEVLTAANPSAKYTVGKLPVMDNALVDGWAANCPQVIAVSSASKHQEAAVKFVDYFFNNEKAMETLAATRSVPATAKAREICEKNGTLSPLLASAADIATSYKGLTDDKYYSSQEAKQIIIDEVEAIGYDAATPESAASDTVSLLNNYIASVN